ncbi:hypothetical protein F511_40560 [Dorcoceras hygrometricum]|uniref:Uncharacterized protein n=1 Tax=Dorcoceras hygrometricum TaxID=472368 RepID=A0A2Z7DHP8_9LAMI|nr:hypothetical protein F511_40560 [Dorcoceras hygrometricum]
MGSELLRAEAGFEDLNSSADRHLAYFRTRHFLSPSPIPSKPLLFIEHYFSDLLSISAVVWSKTCRLGEEVELVGKWWLIRGLRAVNRAVDFMESLAVGQPRVQQPSGQSVELVSSRTSSSQPSVAPQSWSRQRFRPRGRQFKRSSSSSSSSGGSSGARPTVSFCGQCGGLRDLTRSSSKQPYRPFPSQRLGFQSLDTSSVRELLLSEHSGLPSTPVDATSKARKDVLPEGGRTVQLLQPCFVVGVRFLPGCEGERQYRTLISLLGSVSTHAPSG